MTGSPYHEEVLMPTKKTALYALILAFLALNAAVIHVQASEIAQLKRDAANAR